MFRAMIFHAAFHLYQSGAHCLANDLLIASFPNFVVWDAPRGHARFSGVGILADALIKSMLSIRLQCADSHSVELSK